MTNLEEIFKDHIRDVPDFPKPGILFKDITTLLKHPQLLQMAGNDLVRLALELELKIDIVAGIESRGFMFGMFLAERLQAGFVPIRKPGKLPAATHAQSYALEYGTDTLHIHQDAIPSGAKVIIHDDLLATGGTAAAAAHLVEKAGGKVVQLSFLIELAFLNGRQPLEGYSVGSVIKYS
ncbi:MAG: adenine phosphoribosyltransferase [Microscillaceae bacterium]|nr:adenine phosphoribosyltransferase [Microscillaceae bacterium]